jgi:hypothetical protein
MYEQWHSAARLAALRVAQSWSPTDSLIIDVMDTKGSIVTAMHYAFAAAQNNSVHAVLGEDLQAAQLASLLSATSVCLFFLLLPCPCFLQQRRILDIIFTVFLILTQQH